ncbi:MAG: UV DNA damage repair endonuclease UvsE [Candidatus Aenigmatarchaeota archaeon]
MRIGYPCMNLTLDCTSASTFRLDSYSEERLKETVKENLDCLEKILEYNVEHNLLFFRITSDLIPFASHEVCKFNWQDHFAEKLRKIGSYIKENDMRITMHPGQYTVLNSKKEGVRERAVADLKYHSDVLDGMELDRSAKINIHVGGVYGNKEESMERFVKTYESLEEKIKKRLVIENDEKSYTVKDCLWISERTSIPVTVDNLHHELNNNDESLDQVLKKAKKTWKQEDGPQIVHYSSQMSDGKAGRHAETIDLDHFKGFLEKTRPHDFDLILEVKDKEKSACRALNKIKKDNSFNLSSLD